MTEPFPPIFVDHLTLPLADAAAAELAAEAMRGEMARLWVADRAAGLEWRSAPDSVLLDGAADETPEALGRRLAGAIRARLVRGPQA
ncbi:hypothetical protein AWB78_07159 [Caballeronia calidae]|uniref:Uncharacterized protein n=1 Tax=Caballeronia calidae TaxID=1777139 RepID=A0A158EEM8_9BURK|nr:hypothetical protein [Caballeronia calidae]SAL04846.1 hypothetical protein AWB78_07159 [Caballeronia calidae]